MPIQNPHHRFLALLFGLVFGWSALVSCDLAYADGLRPFKAGSLSEIQARRVGKPFMLVFWSVDCPCCVKELADLAAVAARYPDLDLVLVSTDEESYAQEAEAVLRRHETLKAEAWIYADSNTQRLRQEIDPAWFGELPRSYFFDTSHHRQPHSGVPGVEQIETWWKATRARP